MGEGFEEIRGWPYFISGCSTFSIDCKCTSLSQCDAYECPHHLFDASCHNLQISYTRAEICSLLHIYSNGGSIRRFFAAQIHSSAGPRTNFGYLRVRIGVDYTRKLATRSER